MKERTLQQLSEETGITIRGLLAWVSKLGQNHQIKFREDNSVISSRAYNKIKAFIKKNRGVRTPLKLTPEDQQNQEKLRKQVEKLRVSITPPKIKTRETRIETPLPRRFQSALVSLYKEFLFGGDPYSDPQESQVAKEFINSCPNQILRARLKKIKILGPQETKMLKEEIMADDETSENT